MLHGKRLGPARRSQMAGFTLVELLLALFLFALVAGVVFAAFAAVGQGVEKGQQSADMYRVGRNVLQYMAQEIGAALPPASSSGDANFRGTKGQGGGEKGHDCITFTVIPTRRFVDQGAGSDVCEVSYYLAQNVEGKSALFRDEVCTLDLDPPQDCPVSTNNQEAVRPLELTDAVVGLTLTYYNADGSHDEWPSDKNSTNLPCQVYIVLTLQDARRYERNFSTMVLLPAGTCR